MVNVMLLVIANYIKREVKPSSMC